MRSSWTSAASASATTAGPTATGLSWCGVCHPGLRWCDFPRFVRRAPHGVLRSGPSVKPTHPPSSPPPPGGGGRRAPVRGRAEEWAVLGARFDALVTGRGGVVCVEGPPGSGKTRFLSEACSVAERRAFRVFRGGADPDSRFAPLTPLLEGAQSDGEPLFDAGRLHALAIAPEQRFWLLQELQERLERAALDRPLAVVLDDVQWCDDLTLLALRTLSSRLSAHAIVWLVAVRGGSSAPEVLTTLDRMERDGALRIRLGPLSDAAVGEIAQDVLGAPPDAATLDVVRRAEGVPLLLMELLHGMTAEGRVVVDGGVARLVGHRLQARFQASIRRRLHGLSAPTGELVRTASVIGHSVTVELLAELLDRPVGALLAPVREALDSDLFAEREGRLVFRHDLIREAVSASLPDAVRRALRRHAAEVLLARGASLSEAASLVLDSAEPGDKAAVQLLRAAAVELSETAPSAAADLSGRALDLTAGGAPERLTIVAETMLLLWRSGRATQARALVGTALPGTMAPQAEAQVRLGLARVSSQYDFTEAARHARAGVALPGIPEPASSPRSSRRPRATAHGSATASPATRWTSWPYSSSSGRWSNGRRRRTRGADDDRLHRVSNTSRSLLPQNTESTRAERKGNRCPPPRPTGSP
ncbi:ATP-binding protein [Kitasatospora misakiensis]|uniref:ATP-binding protein n=1 Tax=Kitasatospora misakiensis TaxID=67330 RepID=A0ABW0X7Q4_9ACTN